MISIVHFRYSDNLYFCCTACECYGHATECLYDEEVDRLALSVDMYGNYQGGGVCQNCQVSQTADYCHSKKALKICQNAICCTFNSIK